MNGSINEFSSSDELARLRKSLDFIRDVVRSYHGNSWEHIGFSCALAAARAEEMKARLSQFCGVRVHFDQLVDSLKLLGREGKKASLEAERHLEAIYRDLKLDQYSFVPHSHAPA